MTGIGREKQNELMVIGKPFSSYPPEQEERHGRSKISPMPQPGIQRHWDRVIGVSSVALVAAAGIIANDACGQLNSAGVDWDTVLLDEQKLSLVGDSDNNRRTGSAEAVHVFPATLFEERQKLAVCSVILCAGFIVPLECPRFARLRFPRVSFPRLHFSRRPDAD